MRRFSYLLLAAGLCGGCGGVVSDGNPAGTVQEGSEFPNGDPTHAPPGHCQDGGTAPDGATPEDGGVQPDMQQVPGRPMMHTPVDLPGLGSSIPTIG